MGIFFWCIDGQMSIANSGQSSPKMEKILNDLEGKRAQQTHDASTKVFSTPAQPLALADFPNVAV